MGTRACSFALLFVLLTCPAYAQAPTFSRADYPSQAGARAIATADFNRDGWPDAAHANTGRDSVTILLNGRNDGSLLQSAEIAVGHGPFDIVAADFNRDGHPDLAVANADNDTISVLINNPAGGFTRSDLAAAGNPRGITAADMNGDALPDIVYTAFLQNRVQVLTGDGAGGFATGWALVGVANRPQGLAPADFNHDGRMDLAVAYAAEGGGVAVLYNSASGALSAQRIGGEENLNVVTAADLNRDGWTDVAAASTGNNRLAIYFGSAAGVRHSATYLTGLSPRGVTAADLNQDGRLDVATANRESHTVSIFTAQASPAGAFDSVELAAGGGSRGVVSADFNHDGLIDLATGNQDAASVTVLWNATLLTRAGLAFRRLDGGYGFDDFPDQVVLGDFDEDGRLDRLTVGGSILFGNGTERPLPRPVGVPMVSDLNGDGHLDLAYVGTSSVRTLLGDGHGGFVDGPTAGAWGTADIVTGLQAGDVNRDGTTDFVVSGYRCCSTEGFLLFVKGNGDGTFAAPVRTPADVAVFISLADADGDTRLDLIHVATGYGTGLVVQYGDGTGAFPRTETLQMLGRGGTAAHVTDLNHDGRPDIVVSTFEGTQVILGSSSGGFAPTVKYDDYAYRIALGDLDGDGHLDMVGNSVMRVRFGRGDGTFGESLGLASYANAPLIADMNNDGLDDIVAGDGSLVLLNLRQDVNTVPTVAAPDDLTVSYADTFNEDEDNTIYMAASGFDADLHLLRYEWRDAQGALLGTNQFLKLPMLLPGTYQLTVTGFDDRGGSASDTMTLTITPLKELVLYAFRSQPTGDWEAGPDPGGALGWRIYNPDRGAAKVTTPLAQPADYVDVWFIADPTQEYKLWIRGKALNDHWANDSAWVQFEHSLNAAGSPAYRIGTTDALPFNLEECSGCGVSGWGWEDDGWGAVNANGTTIRFAQGGLQRLRIQRREDGLSIDQIVLSAEQYRHARPGTAKNDTTILPERRR